MKSEKVTKQINEAVAKAKAGQTTIKNLIAQLDSYNEFYTGLTQYTAGVDSAYDGSKTLSAGATQLYSGTKNLHSGATQLKNGTEQLTSGGSTLIAGVNQLDKGASDLKDGTASLVTGVGTLHSGALQLIDKLKATVALGKDYDTFGGKSDKTEGTVKFIYRTESISADDE